MNNDQRNGRSVLRDDQMAQCWDAAGLKAPQMTKNGQSELKKTNKTNQNMHVRQEIKFKTDQFTITSNAFILNNFFMEFILV